MTTVRRLKSPLTWAGLVLLAVLCCAQLAAFIWFARRYPITPFSDFEGYWNEAGNLAEYFKGGALAFLFWPFKALGLSPTTAALILHSLSFLGVVATTVRYGFRAQAGAPLYRVLTLVPLFLWFAIWVPLVGFVEVMLIHTSLLIIGLQMLYLSQRRAVVIVGMVLVYMSFTMRAQAMLIFGMLIVVFGVLSRFVRIDHRFAKRTLLLIPCLILAVGTETTLLHFSNNRELAKHHQRAPLYAGWVTADTKDPQICGAWSMEAAELSRKELDLPVTQIIARTLQTRGVGFLFQIAACKLNRVPRTQYISAGWPLIFYVHLQKQPQMESQLLHYADLETQVTDYMRYGFLTLLGILLVALVVELRRGQRHAAGSLLFLALLLLAHAVIYAVFELNSRYLLSLYGCVAFAFLTYRSIDILESPKPV